MSAESLRVRAYNVRFGDAILITIPDRDDAGEPLTRHVLIDVGNVLVGTGGRDEVFEPVVRDVLEQLGGRPLDLYVMTHEHMDHVQGLPWAKAELGLEVPVRHAWLTASAATDYYDRFPEAKKKRLAAVAAWESIQAFCAAAPAAAPAGADVLLANNDPRSTSQCVEYLRGLAEETAYVHRGAALEAHHPFREAKLTVWAPEEDTSVYYGRFRPVALGAAGGDAGGDAAATAGPAEPTPPPGVDAGAFYDLVAHRRHGLFDNLLAIDRAANDSSVVFLLEWRGWRLLFPGDAEHRSWKEMAKRGLFEGFPGVHFLKVGHHGSWNGTPDGEVLDALLPETPPDGRPRRALVSTCAGTYNAVPHGDTLHELELRCDRVVTIGEPGDAPFVDLEFPAGGG